MLPKYTRIENLRKVLGEDLSKIKGQLFWLYNKAMEEPEMVRVVDIENEKLWFHNCEKPGNFDREIASKPGDQLMSVVKPLDIDLSDISYESF